MIYLMRIATLIFILLGSAASLYAPLEVSFPQAAGVYASVSATLLGFMMAVLAILASLSGRPLIKNMGRVGLYKKLLSVLYMTICCFGVSTFLSLISLFVLAQGAKWLIIVATGFMAGGAFTLAVGLVWLRNILNLLAPKDGKPLSF